MILRAVIRAKLARRGPALRAQYGGRAACSSGLRRVKHGQIWGYMATIFRRFL